MADFKLPTMNKIVLNELAHYMCGKKLGSGAFRNVYVLRANDEHVIKIEDAQCSFQNVIEWGFWQENGWNKDIGKWLAPCVSISASGTFLIQKRTTPVTDISKMPAKLPKFLGDCHMNNFGKLDGKLVCHDYAINNVKIPMQLVKRKWYDPYTE